MTRLDDGVPPTPTTGAEVERMAARYHVVPELVADLLAHLRHEYEVAAAGHTRVRDRAAAVAGVLAEVCHHHRPIAGTRGLYCGGCDCDEEPPPWPCSTWTMIRDEVGE